MIEALQVLCAVLLTEEEVEIHNIPDILDVQRLIQLIDGLGVDVERIDKNTYRFCAKRIDLDYFGSHEFQMNAKKILCLPGSKKHFFQNQEVIKLVEED